MAYDPTQTAEATPAAPQSPVGPYTVKTVDVFGTVRDTGLTEVEANNIADLAARLSRGPTKQERRAQAARQQGALF
jgi:hypothetical protein